ncbi:heme-binding domain-containing protein [Melioribacter sp. OK-6-Me]|uniref:heme-binding domain-containing protein n=1 Tax=unclassified Melioribacter TaxID=2627329 RepID=UPI003ED9EB1B
MKLYIKIFIVILTVGLIGIQFIKVDRKNPLVKGDLKAPQEVKNILKESCYDCHSNETKWPWYSYIAPFSLLIEKDVKEGRSELNFSEWETYDANKKSHLKKELWEEIENDKMPKYVYTLTRPNVKLDFIKKSIIKKWALGY